MRAKQVDRLGACGVCNLGTDTVPVGVLIDDCDQLREGRASAEHTLHALAGLTNSSIDHNFGAGQQIKIALALVHAASLQRRHHLCTRNASV